MRILLQRLSTKEFFADGDVWVDEREKAFDFETSRRAVTFCVARGLWDVRIVIAFDRKGWDITLPVKRPGRS